MRARIAAVVTVLLLPIVLVAACVKYQPVGNDADLSNPNAVIQNALETMFTWQPTKDTGPTDAYKRASQYLTQSLADQASKQPPPQQNSQWTEWRDAKAVVNAKVYFLADETPPNTDDQINRVTLVIQEVTNEPGTILIREIRTAAWVTVNRSSGGWRVSNMQFG